MQRIRPCSLVVVGILALELAACGGGVEEAPPASPKTSASAPPTTAATGTAPAETTPAASAPPSAEVPASYVAAQSAESAQLTKFIDVFKDDKASCGKLADSLTTFVKDLESAKTIRTFYEERAKLTAEQKAAADKKAAPEDIQARLASADPVVQRCKKDSKFSDALGKAFAAFMPPPGTLSATPKK